MAVVQVAAGVWVASAPVAAVRGSGHPADVAASTGMRPHRAREFLAGRDLLRATLAHLFPRAADAEVASRTGGKPYLRGHPGVGISVSHDAGVAAVGVALGKEIGVDVQRPDRSVRPGLLRRCLGRHADAVAALSTRDAAMELAWVWTVQEACVKATGAGLAGRPWAIEVVPGHSSGQWPRGRWVSLRDRSRIPFSCAFSTDQPGRSM
ncbi:4'-phosphopantetheinyl transferase family protein [Labedaea rhizosphaerae]|uniref:4'-phosphopantetheinyl transferase n=1 Tax=Labedaea rhizosphaerae TaxID=598644 RepID=A0A4R6RVX9_LABRH|nr:4'-phosphopantetheinyl transferase superfamily protein [Labedaea rhizosphaerae]TDP90597.1 4'-phosphopantetheinyl transferase [Labedaea rhizosphaerae]